MKLLITLITQNTTNQEEIKSAIRMIQPDTFGTAFQQEVSTLLENLGGMADIIEANFSQIKDVIQTHKE